MPDHDLASVTSRPALSDEQKTAFDAVGSFLCDPSRRSFVLHGLAGTGKTTVLAEIARKHPASRLCTLTGKAASVLQRKTGLDASTVHSAFYRLLEIRKDQRGRRDIKWETSNGLNQLDGEVLLLDESSMINESMARDILASGIKIVACGDPGQLSPITGKAFFCEPDVTLRTIHRQALESPIIRQAHAVRNGDSYAPDGPDFQVVRTASDEDVRACDAILCWTNKTKDTANREARRVRGLWMPAPQAGEPVMCLRNNPTYGLFNGAVYTLAASFVEGSSNMRIDVDGRMRTIQGATFAGLTPPLGLDEETAVPFTFGYAMTVHKAQGSEFRNVILIDEYPPMRPDRAEWVYTGITRAAERIMVLRS